MLQSLDTHWREHLAALDHLRQGIHLRGYAQKNPKQEYKREAFELFGAHARTIKREVTQDADDGADPQRSEELPQAEERASAWRTCSTSTPTTTQRAERRRMRPRTTAEAQTQPFVRRGQKVGRNDPCPCGSGKKYKQCHGKLT